MASSSPKIVIKKYFGPATIQEMPLTLDEAKGYLEYFWTEDGGKNIIISVNGQTLKSYEDLKALAEKAPYKNSGFIQIGLYLSNDGTKSIWD